MTEQEPNENNERVKNTIRELNNFPLIFVNLVKIAHSRGEDNKEQEPFPTGKTELQEALDQFQQNPQHKELLKSLLEFGQKYLEINEKLKFLDSKYPENMDKENPEISYKDYRQQKDKLALEIYQLKAEYLDQLQQALEILKQQYDIPQGVLTK